MKIKKKKRGQRAGLTLYELNKIALKNSPALDEDEFQKAKETIAEWHKAHPFKYAMLLFKDLSYYTMFAAEPLGAEGLSDVAIECAQCAGDGVILSIAADEDNGALEFWIHDKKGEPTIGYLFDYSDAVIAIKEV